MIRNGEAIVAIAIVAGVGWSQMVAAQAPTATATTAGAPSNSASAPPSTSTPPIASALPAAPAPPSTSDRSAGEAAGSAESLVLVAKSASLEAALAPSAAEAKGAATRASKAATAIDAIQSATPAQKDSAKSASESAKKSVTQKQAAESLCGAPEDSPSPKAVCLVYGLFAASLSVVRVDGEGESTKTSKFLSGQSSHHLTAIAVPFAGIRILPQIWLGAESWGFISLDIAGYSAFLTQSIGSTAPSAPKTSCSSSGGDFAAKLPCEANAAVHPYAGAYAGITIGKSGLAYMTLIPFTLGVAQVGSLPGLHLYTGWSLGALQLNGSL